VDEDYPRTMLEFEDRFRTEDACRAYLSQLRWPEGFRCPCCGRGQAHEPDTLAVPRPVAMAYR